MGVVASFQLRRADRRMAKTLVFVKCAFAGDVARLQEIMTRDKVAPNAQDRFGMTALHWAAYGGKLVCVQELIKAGASIAIVDANGRNALHHACRKDHAEVVRYLLTELKMDVNALSESKDTPLHKAVIGKSLRSIEVLLQSGANPSLKNDARDSFDVKPGYLDRSRNLPVLQQNRTPLDELDSDPSVVKDVLPEPIATARIQEELDTWRREFITEVASNGRRRASMEALVTPKSRPLNTENLESQSKPPAAKYASGSKLSVREVENTLVTSFRARISEFSERTSSAGDLSAGSRPSSANFVTKSLWAKPSRAAGVGSSGSSGSDTHGSTGRRDSLSGKTAVVPLNLQGLQSTSSATSEHAPPVSDTNRSPRSSHTGASGDPGSFTKNPQRRNLRYAGKRVIMALRVKKVMTAAEKVEVIRLMLQRHMRAPDGGPDAVQTLGNDAPVQEEGEQQANGSTRELIRATSGVKLSMPPTF